MWREGFGRYEIDLEREELIRLNSELPKRIARLKGGRAVAQSTIYRWARKGLKGLRLPTVQVGRELFTSAEAVGWWCSQLARVERGSTRGVGDEVVPRNREASEILRRAGIL